MPSWLIQMLPSILEEIVALIEKYVMKSGSQSSFDQELTDLKQKLLVLKEKMKFEGLNTNVEDV